MDLCRRPCSAKLFESQIILSWLSGDVARKGWAASWNNGINQHDTSVLWLLFELHSGPAGRLVIYVSSNPSLNRDDRLCLGTTAHTDTDQLT